MEDKGLILESMQCAGTLLDSALKVVGAPGVNPMDYSFAVMSIRAGIGLYLKSIDRLMDELLRIASDMVPPESEQVTILRIVSKMDAYGMNISGGWFEQQTQSLRKLTAFYSESNTSPAEVTSHDFSCLVQDSWRELDKIAAYLYFQELIGYYYGQEWRTGYS